MRTVSLFRVSVLAVMACVVTSRQSESAQPPELRQWTKTLKDQSERGKLQDRSQNVRGDSGKWNDEAALQHAGPIPPKPPAVSLDDWFEGQLEADFQLTSNDDNWLLFRSRQLDDNDRVWVERIERNGNQFTVTLHRAIWQGRYRKNFTYYSVAGVNLGKLEPGKYEARWIIKPLKFSKFTGEGQARGNWPQDEQPAAAEPTELKVEFSVAPAP